MKKLITIFSAMVFLIATTAVYSGEYTNRFRIKVKTKGESLKDDPVESFNSALEYAKSEATTAGEGVLRGREEMRDAVLEDSWIKKEAHLQVVDLQVLDYKFWRHNSAQHGNSLVTDIEVGVTMEYLDIPTFIHDYQKTIVGASYRSMAIPGWGQMYNNQHMTGFLYGLAFWAMYGMFINRSIDAGDDSSKIDDAFVSYQIPAMILWSFNVSEAATSRYLGHQGLTSLRKAYRLENYRPSYQRRTERGFKLDLVFVEIPLYKIWRD